MCIFLRLCLKITNEKPNKKWGKCFKYIDKEESYLIEFILQDKKKRIENNESTDPLEIFFFKYDMETFINLNKNVIEDIKYWINTYNEKKYNAGNCIEKQHFLSIVDILQLFKKTIEKYNNSIVKLWDNDGNKKYQQFKALNVIYNNVEDLKKRMLNMNLYNENEFTAILK